MKIIKLINLLQVNTYLFVSLFINVLVIYLFIHLFIYLCIIYYYLFVYLFIYGQREFSYYINKTKINNNLLTSSKVKDRFKSQLNIQGGVF